MDIDILITALKRYKNLGARRVLLSTNDVQPPEQLEVVYFPLGDIVYARTKHSGLPSKAPVILGYKEFKTLDADGRKCEVCGHSMHHHSWAAFDRNGFVVNCDIAQGVYQGELIRSGQIKRRAMDVEGEALKAYE